MDSNKTSVQELAEFLRNMAYSKKLLHHTDWTLFVKAPKDENGDVVYKGSLRTHNRVETPLRYYALMFNFTMTRGIFAIKADKDECAVHAEDTMNFEQFKSFCKKLFEVENLYKPSKSTEPKRARPAKDVPSLQELTEFLVNVSESENSLNYPVDWLLYVLHPSDDNNDVSYSGGLWTKHNLNEPYPKPYNSTHFSYSKACGNGTDDQAQKDGSTDTPVEPTRASLLPDHTQIHPLTPVQAAAKAMDWWTNVGLDGLDGKERLSMLIERLRNESPDEKSYNLVEYTKELCLPENFAVLQAIAQLLADRGYEANAEEDTASLFVMEKVSAEEAGPDTDTEPSPGNEHQPVADDPGEDEPAPPIENETFPLRRRPYLLFV